MALSLTPPELRSLRFSDKLGTEGLSDVSLEMGGQNDSCKPAQMFPYP